MNFSNTITMKADESCRNFDLTSDLTSYYLILYWRENHPRPQGLAATRDRNLAPRARDLQGKNRELWDNP